MDIHTHDWVSGIYIESGRYMDRIQYIVSFIYGYTQKWPRGIQVNVEGDMKPGVMWI